MAERFKKLKDIELRKQVINCPVEIEKGAIIYDAKKQECLLQLKLRNLTQKAVNEISVEITCYDENGNVFNADKPVKYTYILTENSYKLYLCDKTAIELKSKIVTSADIKISRVIYDENSVWEYDVNYERVPKEQTAIPKILLDELMRESDSQYPLTFFPVIDNDEWYCACGKINIADTCSRCGTKKDWIFEHTKITNLKENLKNYISVQSKLSDIIKSEREEEKQLEKSNRRRLLFIGTSIVVLAVMIVIGLIVSNKYRFDKGNDYLSKEEYVHAISQFRKIQANAYEKQIAELVEDLPEKVMEEYACEEADYDETQKAISYFLRYISYDEYKNYCNDLDKLKESHAEYKKGIEYQNNGDYKNAILCYENMYHRYNHSGLADTKLQECQKKLDEVLFPELEKCKAANDYETALNLIYSDIKYHRGDKNFDLYKGYFLCIKYGEETKGNSVSVGGETLYTAPNKNCDSGYYVEYYSTNSFLYAVRASSIVYDYKPFLDNNEWKIWFKIQSGGQSYWILKSVKN